MDNVKGSSPHFHEIRAHLIAHRADSHIISFLDEFGKYYLTVAEWERKDLIDYAHNILNNINN